ncbi:MAG: sigma 54-interacting transcriptional regulator, partial [Acidobacteriota bacterium]
LLLASAGVVDPGLLTVHGRGPVPGIEPEPPPEGVAVARLGSVAHSLSLWLFGAPAGPFAERLLEVVLRWLGPAHLGTARPGPSRHDSARSGVAESAGGTPPRGDGLVFPCGYLRGGSRAMVAVYSQMRLLTQGDVPVLVFGETGVGKELLARALHLSSSRADGPMVTINCAAIPAELLEAELFGIGRGVATGVSARPGRFAEAEGGTLFLDEIGDMPAALQAKLLRALQEREVQPLGGQPMAVDVRVISATNTQLEESMRAGRFRRDLYYRLAGYVLRVPSLAERRDDVPHLVEHFLRTFSDEIGKPIRGVTVKALETLRDYPWPGNVRQLEHEVRRLVYVARAGQAIDSGLLSPEILTGSQGENAAEPNPVDGSQRSEGRSSGGSATLDLATLDLATLEKEAIQRALEASGGVLTEAAQTLGISRDALRRRLIRHGLRPGGGEG